MIGLCHDCFESGLEVLPDSDNSQPVCDKCMLKRSRSKSPEPFCTCTPCPVHKLGNETSNVTVEKVEVVIPDD